MNTVNYQGVRMIEEDKQIHYPGVRVKGSSTKVVRKVSNQGQVYTLLSWKADISEEQLLLEQSSRNRNVLYLF
jgi:hypothetical protein